MARFLLVIAGVIATLQSQPAGAVQPCPQPNACAQLSINSATGLPGDTANAEIWFQQGPSDGVPGGLDEIAALVLTLSFDASGADAPLRLADCTENANGLPNAITPDAALANFNIAVYGPVVDSGATPTVATLPSGRFFTIAFQIEATATGTVPLHVYNAWTDSQHPQSTALVSIGDDLQVDQTCAPLSKPPCGAGSVSRLAITDGAIGVIATPTPALTSTGTATVTASSTATQTGTVTPSPSGPTPGPTTPTRTLTPTGTGSATLPPTPTYTATQSPSATASLTSTHVPTSTLTPSGTPISTATHTETPTSTPTTESTSTPILTPTITPPPPRCVGDCNNDGVVTVDEILMLVDFALQKASPSGCPVSNVDENQQITLDEILTAVYNALNGCPSG
jgi:hypothetical protein